MWSEDDIRTKVIYVWLREHGFEAQHIRVEFGFKIRAGKQILSTPRCDILVTDTAGRNLLIVEVKAPTVTLSDTDRDQAISYAGMVANGNQVPFVVLTNGSTTRIYESATRRLLDGEAVPSNHRYVQSGYIISGDDVALLKDLVDLFVSLTPENLLRFCKAQIDSRMRLLLGHEIDSGKKYIPKLYVDRTAAGEKLRRYLDDEACSVVFVIGKPQVGKTNFICHTVEQRISSGNPVLFFPAISMEDRLSNEIAKDFGWLFNGAVIDSAECWTRLHRVVRKAGKKLQLFVDGWNEGTREVIKSIHRDYDLFAGSDFQLVRLALYMKMMKRFIVRLYFDIPIPEDSVICIRRSLSRRMQTSTPIAQVKQHRISWLDFESEFSSIRLPLQTRKMVAHMMFRFHRMLSLGTPSSNGILSFTHRCRLKSMFLHAGHADALRRKTT